MQPDSRVMIGAPSRLHEKNVIEVIPARGVSKGIPGKNIREVAGKPLIVPSIEASLNYALISRAVVSTDDAKIAEIANDEHLKKDLPKIPGISIVDWQH